MEALTHGPARFDDLAAQVMEANAMRLTHTKDLVTAMRQQNLVTFDLLGKAKKPQPETVVKATGRSPRPYPAKVCFTS